ncbi:MAG TPA: hypothetical protein PKD51_16000 [Saprospiraceae bacterium]|nr:hypothetical protein [Saprospiraceae bacterium]HMU05491.1 hypothetical protein [Saprospiraceae bacterium]
MNKNPSKESSRKYFETLYQAYKNGDIDGNAFTLYLGRFYSIIYNKRLDLERPCREGFDLYTLVKVLDLQQLKNEVDQDFENH